MSNPVKQHLVPKAYLKHFVINPLDPEMRSMVWHGYKTDHGSRVEKVSINADKLKMANFYTMPEDLEDPYWVERTFSNVIEPQYGMIMGELGKEEAFTVEWKATMLGWLFYSKYRNITFRKSIESFLKWYHVGTTFSSSMTEEERVALKQDIEANAAESAKRMQIETFENAELISEFQAAIGSKEWIILKSRKGKSFITSDEPGFSINEYIGDPANLNSLFAGNVAASNYFPFSPRYCLLIKPYEMGTPLDWNVWSRDPQIVIASGADIDYINACTCRTRAKYIFSQSKEVVQEYLKCM
ncbi:MAG: DUF4238 domain-containing protein [Pseudobacter sp.]|uniref:DUF4238 domain-containing protein n=1 Tax=Pseudobacter sp. TaxID=2045420 RepID=UPI003F7D6269